MIFIHSEGEQVALWLTCLEDGSRTIPQVLYSCFNHLGTGKEMGVLHDNGIELVKFASRCARMANDIPHSNTPARIKFLSTLDSLADRLWRLSQESEAYEAEKEALWARELYRRACDDFTSVRYCNIYKLILDNWEQLNGWSGTYRLLENLVCIQADWNNSDNIRDELIRIIETMTSEW